jgi:hypothetical protein
LLIPRTNGFGMHATAEIEEDIEFDIVDAQGLIRENVEKAIRVLYQSVCSQIDDIQIPEDILFGPQTLGSEDDYIRYIKV